MKFNDPDVPIEDVPDDTPSYVDGSKTNVFLTKGNIFELADNDVSPYNHTARHGDLPTLSIGARNAEVEIGGDRINVFRRILGLKPKYDIFAYPFGHYLRQMEYIQDLGYAAALSTEQTNIHTSATTFHDGRIRKS